MVAGDNDPVAPILGQILHPLNVCGMAERQVADVDGGMTPVADETVKRIGHHGGGAVVEEDLHAAR
jgi:hypothetical protein